MKKIVKILPVALLIVASLASCKLENFDKWLTDGEWILSTANNSGEAVASYDVVDAAFIDFVSTERITTDISGGSFTEVEYLENKPSGGTVTFDRTTTKGKYTQKFTFNEDGTYTMTIVRDNESTQVDDETGNGPIVNISQEPATNTTTGYWNWVDDTDKKTALNIENLGTVETTVEKDALSLTYNTNTSENYRTIQSGKEVIVNINTNNMNTWSFTK